MGFRRTAWIVALVVGWLAIVVTTPVVVHAVMAERAAPDPDVTVAPSRTAKPKPVPSPVDEPTTTTTLPEHAPQVDLGGTGQAPAPAPLATAEPDDRTSWEDFLGPLSPMDVSEAEIAGAMYSWINHERAVRGIAPLAWSADLAHSARWWTIRMVGYDAGHSQMLGKLPIRYTTVAENVGTVMPGDGALLHKALVNSAPHLFNVVDPRVDVVGIGVACDPNGRLYVTQHFGARLPETPIVGRAPSWRSSPDASVGPTGRPGPERCDGSWPASEDPPEPTSTTSSPPTTTTTQQSRSGSSTTTSSTTSSPPPTTTSTTSPPPTTTTSTTSPPPTTTTSTTGPPPTTTTSTTGPPPTTTTTSGD